MATFTATCTLAYSPAIVNTDNTESSVTYEWELRDAGTDDLVVNSGSGSCTWDGSKWTTGEIDVGDAPENGANIYYKLNAQDTVAGVDASNSTGWLFGKFVEFIPITQICYELDNGPTYDSWSFNTYTEESWTEVTVPASDSDLDTSVVVVKGELFSDSFADTETLLVVEKGSTTRTSSVPDSYNGTWTSDTMDFTGESADGLWKVYFTDSFGDGGAELYGTPTLCIGPVFVAPGDVSVPDIGTSSWFSDTFTENGESSVAVASGNPLTTVSVVFTDLITDQYASTETEIFIESPEGTIYSEYLPSNNSGSYTVSTGAFSTDSDSGGTWTIRFTDSYGDGGAEGTGVTLEFA